MQQVFINLLVNASDAVQETNGRISVSTKLVSLSPYGTLQIKNAVCSKHSLMDDELKIDSKPSVKLKLVQNGKEGFVNLDPIYGKNRDKYNLEIKSPEQIQISCPKCNISVIDKDANCPKCKGTIYSIEVPPRGMFEGCINPSCDWQRWASVDEAGIRDYVEIIISDNGTGISKEDLSRIFEPLHRGNQEGR